MEYRGNLGGPDDQICNARRDRHRRETLSAIQEAAEARIGGMKMVRAKFFVRTLEKSLYGYAPNQQEMTTVVLSPVYSAEPGTENKKFWDATPSGEIKLGTINKAAADQFVIGKEYYIDFSPAS